MIAISKLSYFDRNQEHQRRSSNWNRRQHQQQQDTVTCLQHVHQVFLIALLSALPAAQAFYVSYETANVYKVGDRVPIKANKLTSPITFAPIDYQSFPLCGDTTAKRGELISTTNTANKKWDQAIESLHGDAFYNVSGQNSNGGITLIFGYDVYCATACTFLIPDDTTTAQQKYIQDMINNRYVYNYYIDELPAIYQSETDETMSVNYWSGVPVGTKRSTDFTIRNSRYNNTAASDILDDDTLFINNHWNIKLWYRPSKNAEDGYSIVRVFIEPYSVTQEYNKDGETKTMASCSKLVSPPVHVDYDNLASDDIPVQQLNSQQPIRLTYDVIWIEAPDDSLTHKNRWNAYLSMDDAIPNYIEFSGFFLGGFLLVSITGILCTWVLRDLSYKPIINQQNDYEEDAYNMNDNGEIESTSSSQRELEIEKEIQMWPLSNRVFFPPAHSRYLLCIACGTGAHLLFTSFCFIVLFRFGIISQSQGANLLTPGIVLYCLGSVCGGYVTARLHSIFHGDMKTALVLSLCTAIIYPLIGLVVVYVVYDILPASSAAPEYRVSSNVSPLIILWICFVWPSTLLSGYYGYKAGPIQNFPVSEGYVGYHDLNLQQDDRNESDDEPKVHSRLMIWRNVTKKYRIPILLATGGLLPILACFVNYSYGVAGPMLLRYYSVRPYMISSFLFFILISGMEAILIFYRQIRIYNSYSWWWATFSTAGSAGIYLFLLSMSYVLFRGGETDISTSTIMMYMIWFAFTSFGVLLMTGFTGVALNIVFVRVLYTYIMNRQEQVS